MKTKYTIGGSEIGTILGFNPYETPMELFCRKLGLLESKQESEPMRWGKAAEHVVARRYAQETTVKLLPSVDQGFSYETPLVHPKYPWWTGTPDRQIIPDGLLEIKIIGERTAHLWGESPNGDVPDMYLLQCHWYMPLVDAKYADLAVQIGNRDYRVYRINRDLEMEDNLRQAAEVFINDHLIPQFPPPIDETAGSRRYLHMRYPKEEEAIIEAPPTAAEWLKIRANAQTTITLAEEEKSLAENKLKEIIGSHEGIAGFGYKATWKKNKDTQAVNWETLAMSLNPTQEQMEQFTILKLGVRVLRVTPIKEKGVSING